MKIVWLLSASAVSALIVACASSPSPKHNSVEATQPSLDLSSCQALAATPPPPWVNSEPSDPRYYYATGEASLATTNPRGALAEAQERAVAALTTTIEVKVETTLTSTLDANDTAASSSYQQRQSLSTDLELEDVNFYGDWLDVNSCTRRVAVRILRRTADSLRGLQNAQRNYDYANSALEDDVTLRLSALTAAATFLSQVDFAYLGSHKLPKSHFESDYRQLQNDLEKLQAEQQLQRLDVQLSLVTDPTLEFNARASGLNVAQELFTSINFDLLAEERRVLYTERMTNARNLFDIDISANRNLLLVSNADKELSFEQRRLIAEKLRELGYKAAFNGNEVLNIDDAKQLARSMSADSMVYVQVGAVIRPVAFGNWAAEVVIDSSIWDIQSDQERAKHSYKGISIALEQELLQWSTSIENAFHQAEPLSPPTDTVTNTNNNASTDTKQ